MAQRVERPIRRERGGQWQAEECLVSARVHAAWRTGSARWRAAVISPRRPWQAANPGLSASRSAGGDAALDALFDELADRWESETMFESVVTRKALHPAYQRIIGLGKPAVPRILRRLAQEPAQWFWALTAITGENPAEGRTKPDEAAAAWLDWGRARGLVSE